MGLGCSNVFLRLLTDSGTNAVDKTSSKLTGGHQYEVQVVLTMFLITLNICLLTGYVNLQQSKTQSAGSSYWNVLWIQDIVISNQTVFKLDMLHKCPMEPFSTRLRIFPSILHFISKFQQRFGTALIQFFISVKQSTSKLNDSGRKFLVLGMVYYLSKSWKLWI